MASAVPAVLDDRVAGYASSVVVMIAVHHLLGQTQLYLLRQRMDVHRLSAWVDRATAAPVLVTVGCATVLAPLEELGAALIHVTRPGAGMALLTFGITGTLLSRGWAGRRSRALLLAALMLTTADVISVAGTLVRSQSSSLLLVIVGLQASLRFFVSTAARRPAPTGERMDEDAPAVLLIPAAALATSVVVLGVDHVSPLPIPTRSWRSRRSCCGTAPGTAACITQRSSTRSWRPGWSTW